MRRGGRMRLARWPSELGSQDVARKLHCRHLSFHRSSLELTNALNSIRCGYWTQLRNRHWKIGVDNEMNIRVGRHDEITISIFLVENLSTCCETESLSG